MFDLIVNQNMDVVLRVIALCVTVVWAILTIRHEHVEYGDIPAESRHAHRVLGAVSMGLAFICLVFEVMALAMDWQIPFETEMLVLLVALAIVVVLEIVRGRIVAKARAEMRR